MSVIKEIFDGWRNFLAINSLKESIDEKTLSTDTQETYEFLNHIQTKQSARLFILFLDDQISYFENLKTLPLDHPDYIKAAKSIFKKEEKYSSVSNDIVDLYIKKINEIKLYLKEKFSV